MLKMLIADDEQFVINGLKNALDWAQYGIEIIGEATDGQEAIDFIRNNKVDILFTDIKMPIMDGIRLIELIRAEKQDIKIVILSGYQDFNYAKSAIQNQVFDYLLKPITLDKIENLVVRLVEHCKVEKELQRFRPLMEEQLYIDLLNGITQKETYSLLGLNLGSRKYKVSVVNIDNLLPGRNHVISYNEKQSLISKILYLLEQELQPIYDVIPIQYDPISIALLFKFEYQVEMDNLLTTLKSIQNKIGGYIGVTISFGIGNTYDDITHIHHSFKEAKHALGYKLYYGNKSISHYTSIMSNEDSNVNIMGQFKGDLINSIKSMDSIKSIQILRNILATLQNNKNQTIESIKKLATDILLTLSFTLYDQNEHLEDIYTDKKDLFEYMQYLDTLDDIFDTLIHVFATTIQYLKKKSESKNNNTIMFITKYINDHISEDITLDKIAQQVFLTPNYIGYIFKEEVGMTFNEYVTRARMEFAKELLAQPENKIYEVSLKVGYKNPHYFSKLFKKHTGVNPSQYKI